MERFPPKELICLYDPYAKCGESRDIYIFFYSALVVTKNDLQGHFFKEIVLVLPYHIHLLHNVTHYYMYI